MAQIAKVIEVTRSFIPIDPNSFPENLMFTAQEDSPEKEPPILAIEGYNFLPTSYGYRSYFGLNSKLDIQPLPSRCDKVLLFQLANFQNVLIALCEDGIYYAAGNSIGGAWTHAASYPIPPVGTYIQWTYALIENTLHFYRQGAGEVWRLKYTDYIETPFSLTFSSLVPTFLNMAGQMGIFRANGRLGFWDSANSISWSSIYDHADFSPAIETLAGNAIFNSVIGRIVAILPQGEGFIIYATKSIVGVRYSNASVNILWDATQITSDAGIVYPFQVTHGLTELEHFAFTNTGIKKIGAYNALNKSHVMEEVVTELFDLLKESKSPVRIDFLGGRFLFFSLIEPKYIDGKVLTRKATAESYTIRILSGGSASNLDITGMNIGAQTYESLIGSSLEQGIYTGMFLWWDSATGQAMIPDRVSPIHPYTLDEDFNLIPNTPPAYDTSSILSPSGVQIIVAGSSYAQPTPASVTLNGSSWLSLNYYSPKSEGKIRLGYVDAGLNLAMSKQQEEWANYKTIMTNTYNAIAQATPVVEAVVQGITPYAYLVAANEAKEHLISVELASHSGAYRTGDSVFWEEGAGVLPGNISTSNAPYLPDIGKHFAHASLTENFAGGYPLKRLNEKAFTARDGGVNPKTVYKRSLEEQVWMGIHTMANTSVQIGSLDFVKFTATVNAAVGLPQTMTKDFYSILSSDDLGVQAASWFDSTIRANLPALVDFSATSTDGLTTYHFTSQGAWSNTLPYETYQEGLYSDGSQYGPWGYRTEVRMWDTPYTTTIENDYYIDTQITKTLTIGAFDPSLSVFDSTLNAHQTDLTYEVYTEYPSEEFQWTDGSIVIPGFRLQGYYVPPFDYTYPGATFLLQDGSLAPVYPDYQGALVLDLSLKKWGKMKASYKALVDYSPVNTLQPAISYSNFGLDMGVLTGTGELFLADFKPTDSYISYGKMGYYRLGMTKLEEVKAHFRSPFTGMITISSSMDGRNLEVLKDHEVVYTDVNNAVVYLSQPGRWHVAKISGIFDLTYLEIRGNIRGRR